MKKYGYVVEMRKQSAHYPGFYQNFYQNKVGYAGPLRTAKVVSRNIAYAIRWDDEVVRKVELFKNGKPKRVVK